jgi:hypothetical protein
MEDRIKSLELKVQQLEELTQKLMCDQSRVKYNEFIGMEIKDFYCNGFFDRDYSLEGSMIIENTDKLLTIRKPNGEILQADMGEWDMREHVEEWTKEDSEY